MDTLKKMEQKQKVIVDQHLIKDNTIKAKTIICFIKNKHIVYEMKL